MIIETKRLILRPFTIDDAKDLLEYLSTIYVNCFKEMKIFNIEEAKKEALERSKAELYFAIVLKKNGKVIGEVFTSSEYNESNTHSPCWMLNPLYQKKGYAYEAVYALFDYLFEEGNVRRIYAYTEDDNISSQHLCEKLGMRREGLFIDYVSFVNNQDGTPKYENTYQYAILKKEWNNRKLRLIPLCKEDIIKFKKDAIEAFQEYENEGYRENEQVLDDDDIDESLSSKSSEVLVAKLNEEIVGGAVVVINEETKHNELEMLYVKKDYQSKGIGMQIWKLIEDRYPDTLMWETITPYFAKRNIHFYVNKCGFKIVEYFSKYHPLPHNSYEKIKQDDKVSRPDDESFVFIKEMKKSN